MKKIRSWLIDRFLPVWAKQSVLKENLQLKDDIAQLRATIREQEAYINGLEHGIRAQRRIIINTKEAPK